MERGLFVLYSTKTVVFCDYLPLGQPPPARRFHGGSTYALRDPTAPAEAHQLAEPAHNLPQELEPIAEPAAPVEVTLFLFPLRFVGVGLA